MTAHSFVVMDAAWLEIVRERSQFLLLQFWRAKDWSLNARPFLRCPLSLLAINDARVRKVGATAILVGAAGLTVALIASLVGSGKHSPAGASVAMDVGHGFCRACYSWCRRCGLCGVLTDMGAFCGAAGDLRIDVFHNRRHDLLGVRLILWLVRDFINDR